MAEIRIGTSAFTAEGWEGTSYPKGIAPREQLGAFPEARQHWQRYVELDPSSPWCAYARQRLASRMP